MKKILTNPFVFLFVGMLLLNAGFYGAMRLNIFQEKTERQSKTAESARKATRLSADATLRSKTIGSISYYTVDQSHPGIVAVKKMSIFLTAIKQDPAVVGHQIISITPLGEPVMIDGEPAYAAVIVIHSSF